MKNISLTSYFLLHRCPSHHCQNKILLSKHKFCFPLTLSERLPRHDRFRTEKEMTNAKILSKKNLSKNHLTVSYGQSRVSKPVSKPMSDTFILITWVELYFKQLTYIFSIISYSALFIDSKKLYQPCKTDRWSKDLQNLFSHFKI